MEAAAHGAPVADVARRHDITRQHIYQWRRELRDKGQLLLESPAFVAVELSGGDEGRDMIAPTDGPGSTGAHRVEIMLRNGRSLRIMADAPDDVLQRLMRVAEQS